jgi:hypothetical protein
MSVKLAKVTDNIEDERWLSEPSELVYIEPDAHLDDVEILVDCE